MPDIRVAFTLNSLLPWKALYLPAYFHKICRNVVSLRPQLLGSVPLESKQQVQKAWCGLTGHMWDRVNCVSMGKCAKNYPGALKR